jgi:hypothetical protein
MINLNHYEYLDVRKQQTNFGIVAFNSGKPELLNGGTTQAELFTKILHTSAALNAYHLPNNSALFSYYPYGVRQKAKVVNDNPELEMANSVREIFQLGNDYFIDGFTFIHGHSAKNQKVFIGFKNQTDALPIFYSTKQIARYDLNPYFHKWNLKKGGYVARIHASDLKPGENKIWLMVSVNGLSKMIETDKTITK